MVYKSELIIVGDPLNGANVVPFVYNNLSITQIQIRRRRRIYLISLHDSSGNITPISKCLIAGNHLISTNLKYKDDADETNDKNRKYIGKIEMEVTIFDTDTFLDHVKELGKLREDFKKEMEKYATQMRKSREEFQSQLKQVTSPYVNLINQQNEEIEKILTQSFIVTLKSKSHMRQMIVKAISKDLENATGLTADELEQETKHFIELQSMKHKSKSADLSTLAMSEGVSDDMDN